MPLSAHEYLPVGSACSGGSARDEPGPMRWRWTWADCAGIGARYWRDRPAPPGRWGCARAVAAAR